MNDYTPRIEELKQAVRETERSCYRTFRFESTPEALADYKVIHDTFNAVNALRYHYELQPHTLERRFWQNDLDGINAVINQNIERLKAIQTAISALTVSDAIKSDQQARALAESEYEEQEKARRARLDALRAELAEAQWRSYVGHSARLSRSSVWWTIEDATSKGVVLTREKNGQIIRKFAGFDEIADLLNGGLLKM